MTTKGDAYPQFYTDRRGRNLYFPHAVPHWPPAAMTDPKAIKKYLEDAYKLNPALPQHKDAKDEMRTPYYFWWAFLKLSDDYARASANGGAGAEAVYAAFGDVSGNNFREWWENKGSRAFSHRLEQVVRVHDATTLNNTTLINTEGQLVVSFPIDGPLNRIWDEIKVLVADRRAALGNVLPADVHAPLFKPLNSSGIGAHFRRLAAYKMLAQGNSRDEVAGYLGVKVGEPVYYRRKVDRWHAEAKSIVKHVCNGHFPVLNDDPPAVLAPSRVLLRRTKQV